MKRLTVSTEHELATPRVDLRRIRNIVTYEVMESDLDLLEQASSDEKAALGFATAAGGALLGAFLGWPAVDANPYRAAAHVTTTILLAILTAWFTLATVRKRRARIRVLDRIKAHARVEALAPPDPDGDAIAALTGARG